MDWNDLRYFLAIARAGTLAGAARELKVDHTTVSRRLSALERDLDAKLFTRAPDGFTLTPAGEALRPRAEEMERAAHGVRRDVQGEDTRVEGTVRVTTSEAFAGYLVQRLAPLRERHPQLLIEILATNRPLDLLRGEADIAMRLARSTQAELIARRVVETGWSVYAAGGYLARRGRPADHEALLGHDVIHFESSLAGTPGARWLGEGRGGHVALRASTLGAAVNATVAGFGVGVLPCLLGDAEATLTRLTSEVVATCDLYLAVHRDLADVARVRAVMDHLVEELTRDAPRLRGR